jgi:hypothetical protein
VPWHVAWFVAVLPLSGMPTAGENLHQKMNEISFFFFFLVRVAEAVMEQKNWGIRLGEVRNSVVRASEAKCSDISY